MSDKPILFSAPMIRALLEGRKTQTRRILKIRSIEGKLVPVYPPEELVSLEDGDDIARGEVHYLSTGALSGPYRIPFAVGDRLWVREAWRVGNGHEETSPRDLPPRSMTVLFGAGGSIANQDFRGDWRPDDWPAPDAVPDWAGRLRPGIHMPRWASRLTLIVTEVRVERLQDISNDDAIAEGIQKIGSYADCDSDPRIDPLASAYAQDVFGVDKSEIRTEDDLYEAAIAPRLAFAKLWRSINGADSWKGDPWVVVVGFEVVKANIDTIERAPA
ncbi:hypothetical protein [Microvirga sp. Mcv34]|uniref:hypothetical protein n=1 Tax=Microvirga sp. Mcv34 TaxID=2926016 RepID=UPI0021C664CF|nr:hypothetical protein [Microvirga sp. Mcv34]